MLCSTRASSYSSRKAALDGHIRSLLIRTRPCLTRSRLPLQGPCASHGSFNAKAEDSRPCQHSQSNCRKGSKRLSQIRPYPIINVNRNPHMNDAVAQLFSIIISHENRSTFPLLVQADIYIYILIIIMLQ